MMLASAGHAADPEISLPDAARAAVASILDLLDAQSQLLTAELGLADAHYGFLADLVAAERQISFCAFLETPADVEALLSGVERDLGLQP